jgi:hypothetical protein
MAPITTTKMDSSGITYTTNGRHLSQPRYLVPSSSCGALPGTSKALPMMYATKVIDSRMPGTIPANSSLVIDMLERLPNSTIRAEGGISMSTPPIAITGPMANVGWYFFSSITGVIDRPSIAVVAIVEPEIAENAVPATTETTESRAGTRWIRRSKPSITRRASPVWNRISPIRMNSGIGVKEKVRTDAMELRASWSTPAKPPM